jgi:hypothetical protein
MSIPRSVTDVIRNHVTLEVEGIDRMYLNVYQPKLQTEKQAACFFRYHRGQPVASSSLMGVMTTAFLQQGDAFVEEHQIPVVPFGKGQRKDDVAAEHRARFQGTEGVLFLGKAQEKVKVFRTEKRTAPNGKKYPWIVKSSVPVNQFYFYCIDEDFGPFFLKFCTYFPYNANFRSPDIIPSCGERLLRGYGETEAEVTARVVDDFCVQFLTYFRHGFRTMW